MGNKTQIGMILQRVEEGDISELDVLVGEMVHLPKVRDFVASVEMMARIFRMDGELDENEHLMFHAHRLASMSKRLYKDRETLKPLLEGTRNVIAEWRTWVEADDPTEEEIQIYLKRVAGAMEILKTLLKDYDSYVLTKLKEDREPN
jgi:hypothetical protein